MKILVKGKVETVSLDRVKPAHLECEPTTGTTAVRSSQKSATVPKQLIKSTKSNRANIANREQILTDQTVRKTRVGRIIQTPARFVQMVHAIVAPNDIYGGPNRMHRITNVCKL